jgi:hypothetical protein
VVDASLTDLDLGASTVTIISVLNEVGVELVASASLPLTLEARPGSDADGATFETPGGTRPKVRVDMSRWDEGVVTFRLVVEFAPSHKPATCAGTPRTTELTTSLQIDPDLVSATTTDRWQCMMGDSQLRVPVPYSYAHVKPSISGPQWRSTALGRVVIEATKPIHERTNAPRSCPQVWADNPAVAQPIQGLAACIGGL